MTTIVYADSHETEAKSDKKGYYIGFGTAFEDNKKDVDAYKGSIKFGKHWNDSFATELYTRIRHNNGASSNQRIEVAAIPSYKLTDDLSTYIRASVGEKYESSNHFTYWGLEPGVKYNLDDDWSVKTGVRFRNAWGESGQHDVTYKADLGYKLENDNTVSLGYAKRDRDANSDEIILGYTINF